MRKAMVWFVAGLILSGIGTAVAVNIVGGGEARIAARRTADGRVEFALQQRQPDGVWGERQLPDQRFLPSETTPGRWSTSSPIGIADGAAGGDLYCLITHGDPETDEYWMIELGAAELTAETLGMNLRIGSSTRGAGQAALIDDCVRDGAAGIAVTLADYLAIRPAMQRAHDAGVLVASFNSGFDIARGAVSMTHIALDDREAGRETGRRLNQAGIDGVAVCVVHEERNVGLADRCGGLEETFDGDVERLAVAGTAALPATRAALAQRLRDLDDDDAVIALNALIGAAALEAAAEADSDPLIASFGLNQDTFNAVSDGRMGFMVWGLPGAQGYHIVNALYAYTTVRTQLPLSSLREDPLEVRIQPIIADRDTVRAAGPAILQRIEEARQIIELTRDEVARGPRR